MSEQSDLTQALNQIIKNELTAINQYFLHARMLKHMGYVKLADIEYKRSIDQMKHADGLVECVLNLGGAPNLQDLGKLSIGNGPLEVLKCDLTLEEGAKAALTSAIDLASAADAGAAQPLLQSILASGEEHIEFINAQMSAIDKNGEQAYIETLTQ